MSYQVQREAAVDRSGATSLMVCSGTSVDLLVLGRLAPRAQETNCECVRAGRATSVQIVSHWCLLTRSMKPWSWLTWADSAGLHPLASFFAFFLPELQVKCQQFSSHPVTMFGPVREQEPIPEGRLSRNMDYVLQSGHWGCLFLDFLLCGK